MSPGPVKISWSFLQLYVLLVQRYILFSRQVPQHFPQKYSCDFCPSVTMAKKGADDRLCWFSKSYFIEVFTSVMLSHTELERQEDLAIATLNTAAPENCCLGDSQNYAPRFSRQCLMRNRQLKHKSMLQLFV